MPEIDAKVTSVNLPPTLKFQMYKHLFQNKIKYDEVWRATWLGKFEAHFNFEIADANLSECLSSCQSDFQKAFNSLTTTATSSTQNTAPFFYSFDKLNYRDTLELTAFKAPGGGPELKFSLNLRLSYDGFLYPPSNQQLTLKVDEIVSNHNCDGWHLLDESELAKFPRALLFAQTILGTSDRPPCFLYYHEDMQRMDLKFRDVTSTCYVYIQFEPGYPVHDFTDDLWY